MNLPILIALKWTQARFVSLFAFVLLVDSLAPVAQTVERRICNPEAAGSIPAGGLTLAGGEA
jgi:hypothetical protein